MKVSLISLVTLVARSYRSLRGSLAATLLNYRTLIGCSGRRLIQNNGITLQPGPARTNSNVHLSCGLWILHQLWTSNFSPYPHSESIFKHAPRAVVEARVRWACPTRATALPCLVCMNHDGLSVKFDPAHWKYRWSHESCWMVFGSTLTSRLCCYCFGDRRQRWAREKGRRKESLYITVVVLEGAKSVRERYIRVAAIDNVITEGSWNICVVNRHESIPCIVTTRNVRD